MTCDVSHTVLIDAVLLAAERGSLDRTIEKQLARCRGNAIVIAVGDFDMPRLHDGCDSPRNGGKRAIAGELHADSRAACARRYNDNFLTRGEALEIGAR